MKFTPLTTHLQQSPEEVGGVGKGNAKNFEIPPALGNAEGL